MDWSLIQESRDLTKGRFPRTLKLPVVPDQFTLVLEAVGPGSRVLDLGANNRRLERILREREPQVVYRGLDPDTRLEQDYRHPREVTEEFDVVACLDVVEHLDPAGARELILEAYRLVAPGGLFLVATPNVCHPVWFRRDSTHRTFFHYNELAGLVLAAGFRDLEVFRVGTLAFKDRVVFMLTKPLLKMLDLDWATSIIIRARK